jgi:type IV pilus assembly protein PilB
MRKRLGEFLITNKLITKEQLDQASELQKGTPAPLSRLLVSLGYITEEKLLGCLASQFGVSPWNFSEAPPESEALQHLPGTICRMYQICPVELRGDLLVLAMQNPNDLEAIDLVRNLTGLRVEPVLPDRERLLKAIETAYGAHQVNETIDTLIIGAIKDKSGKKASGKEGHDLDEEEDNRIIALVNQLLSDAIRMGASDVHVEPRSSKVEVRYRIDGQLQKIRELPVDLLPMVVTRLKIMAELDIVEFRVPQDGRVAAKIDGRDVDMRISVLPNHHGQRIVLRILDKSVSLKTMEQLGFSDRNLQTFRTLIRKPYGMILVTGPTGSGKTTTLYASLMELRSLTNNIMTCEDPVEYELSGINQSQVNEKVGLTFAAQLRAILRQDPDVILVGEIRDGETAETALRASMTGHLVLSTLHCNDSVSAVPRLLDMDVDPFLLSTSLIGVMSQRLLRVLCPHCRIEYLPDETDKEILVHHMEAMSEDPSFAFAMERGLLPNIFEGKGCAACAGKGYKGRTSVHEIMAVTGEVAKAIGERAQIDQLREAAMHYSYRPMYIEAMKMVLEGRTSLAEATRVVFFESNFGPREATPAIERRRVATG